MQFGFAKNDITPRLGIELCGFGPFINRRALAVRDRLWARAMAVRRDGVTLVLVSNDLVGVTPEITALVRRFVREEVDLPDAAIMVHCTHTHSGPNTINVTGWGVPDPPYIETLPRRIARAAVEAVKNLREATLSYAATPCEGISLNREYDRDAPPLEEVLRGDWRPAKPELTDTTTHVFTVKAENQLIGFFSYFGCHPVVCCADTHALHGDFCGVATGMLEREHPGAVGLFLQGAFGDQNTCVVHKPETDSLLALDVIAARYANRVREGMRQAQPLALDSLACHSTQFTPGRLPMTVEQLQAMIEEQEAILRAPGAGDADPEVRLAAVKIIALRRILTQLQSGEATEQPTELQAFRIGPLALLATPFEIFRQIKEDIVARAQSPIPLVLGITNDELGYAPDRDTADRGGYAAQQVPLMLGALPFRNIHDELVARVLEMEEAVMKETVPAFPITK
jgi:hypothetical protein